MIHKQVKSTNVNDNDDEQNDCNNCNNNSLVSNSRDSSNNNNINWYSIETGNNKKPVEISDKCAQFNVFLGNAVNRTKFFTFYRNDILFNGLVILVLFNTICICAASVNPININNVDNNFGGHLKDKIHFSKYSIVRPSIYDGTKQRTTLSTTRQENGEHASHIILEYKHNNKAIIADLHLNTNLIPKEHFLSYQNADGSESTKRFDRHNIDLCHYTGKIRGNPRSHIALSTCDGLKGIVHDGTESYSIHPDADDVLDGDHLFFRHIDALNHTSCGSDSHDLRSDSLPLKNTDYRSHLRLKRSTATEIKGPYNANKQSSYVELVFVVDNKVYKNLNENLEKVHKHCKDIANIINALYIPLNIFVALIGVVVWNEKNEVELSNDGDKTLKNFLLFRRKVLSQKHPNDNAQLLTGEQFDGGVVGKALKGPICTYEFSGGVAMDHSPMVDVVATTVAHEMGHNFGMEHDTPDCKCADDRCIMSPSSSSIAPLHWSSCSIDQLNLVLHQGMNYCLRNKPKMLFNPPECGNGFVEAGEECDCGLPRFCTNTCCDPNTCKLYSNATCATGECCDLKTCSPKEGGVMCRSADSECDLPEYCNGESEFCPVDYYKRDAAECDKGKSYCYHGACRSRDDQCKLLWGPSGKSSEQCYEKNLDGTRHGNCGYNKHENVYKNCSREDIFCGMLQCRHLNERLEFGMESVAILSHSFISDHSNIIPCRAVIVDLGLESADPGLTPDGATCSTGKMCVKQKCVAIETLKSTGVIKDCPHDCNGRGVCDNLGHCHCDKGFAPPDCDAPGPGGSIHSGPATNPDDGSGFTRILYVFFLGVVPFISLSLFLLYYWRQNQPLLLRRTPNSPFKISVRPKNERDHRPPPPPPNVNSTATNIDETNASLLKVPKNADDDILKQTMFGHFKGFSLKPLPMSKPNIVNASNVAYVHPVAKNTESDLTNQSVPFRAAPPPPLQSKIAAFQSQTLTVPEKAAKPNPYKPSTVFPREEAHQMPTMHRPDPKDRPQISSPILKNSTCAAKELMSPKRQMSNITSVMPINNPSAQPVQPVVQATTIQHTVDSKSGSDTLKRIASFLKKPEPKTPPPKKITIDRNALKNLEISAPIKTVNFGRSQSMRSPSSETAPKRNALASASMRQPSGNKRPVSIVDRPRNPPPPRPPAIAATGNSQSSQGNVYDDCESSSLKGFNASTANSTDNIYCVIDEKPPLPPALPPANKSGLLNEIVNEIESRNMNSIYSVANGNRNKNGQANSAAQVGSTYDKNKNLNKNSYQNFKSNNDATKNVDMSEYQRPKPTKPVPIHGSATAQNNNADNGNKLSGDKNLYTNTQLEKPVVSTNKPIVPIKSKPQNLIDKKIPAEIVKKVLPNQKDSTITAAARKVQTPPLSSASFSASTKATGADISSKISSNNNNNISNSSNLNKQSSQNTFNSSGKTNDAKKTQYSQSMKTPVNATKRPNNSPTSSVLSLQKKFEKSTPQSAGIGKVNSFSKKK